ncbi:MAG: tail fiber domain-containing protein [Bacteroidetes bacterium]|nr:tail fiber domain-containing protein [Bacteroidota bacterium]
MEKLFTIFFPLLLLALGGNCQWATSGSNIYNTNSGYVGIGTNSPVYNLDIFGVNPILRIRNTSAPNSSIIQADASGVVGFFRSDITPIPAVRMGSSSNYDFYLAANNTNWMVIKTTGKVGINTSTPNFQLDINGSINATSYYLNGSPFTGGSGWSLTGNAGTIDGTNFIGTTDNVPFNIRVNNVKSGRIDPILNNTFFGYNSSPSISSGSQNTAMGSGSLYSNNSGSQNTAIGYQTLYGNNGSYNTAIGYQSLYLNTSGTANTSLGTISLPVNSTGYQNTAIGYGSLADNTSGYNNVAIGTTSLSYNTNGNSNTAIGFNSGPGSSNPSLSNTTAVGYQATPTASNTIVIGNSSVTSIGGQVSWSTLSDGRFKLNIKEDVLGLDFIKKLRPVTYQLNSDIFDKFTGAFDKMQNIKTKGLSSNIELTNAKPVRYSGFVAQEVEAILKNYGKTFSGLVAPQNEKDHYSLRYSDFVVPLVKAVQELSNQMVSQNKKIDSLTNLLDALRNHINPGQIIGGSSIEGQAYLNQNFPNPFSINTQINMFIPETSQQAVLMITNLQGAQLKTIYVNGKGNISVNISGGELSSGIYLYSLIVNNQLIDTKRMVITN